MNRLGIAAALLLVCAASAAADPVIDRITARLEPGRTVVQMPWILPLVAAGIRHEQAVRATVGWLAGTTDSQVPSGS